MLLYGHPGIAAWAGRQLGIQDWGPCQSIGVMARGNLVAAAVFHQYRHPNIEISFVTVDKRWATPQTVRGIMRYPFIQLGCKRLTAITSDKNHPTREFLCRLGFVQEGYHPDAFESSDAVTYGLLRAAAARWLTEDRDNRKEFTLSARNA